MLVKSPYVQSGQKCFAVSIGIVLSQPKTQLLKNALTNRLPEN